MRPKLLDTHLARSLALPLLLAAPALAQGTEASEGAMRQRFDAMERLNTLVDGRTEPSDTLKSFVRDRLAKGQTSELLSFDTGIALPLLELCAELPLGELAELRTDPLEVLASIDVDAAVAVLRRTAEHDTPRFMLLAERDDAFEEVAKEVREGTPLAAALERLVVEWLAAKDLPASLRHDLVYAYLNAGHRSDALEAAAIALPGFYERAGDAGAIHLRHRGFDAAAREVPAAYSTIPVYLTEHPEEAQALYESGDDAVRYILVGRAARGTRSDLTLPAETRMAILAQAMGGPLDEGRLGERLLELAERHPEVVGAAEGQLLDAILRAARDGVRDGISSSEMRRFRELLDAIAAGSPVGADGTRPRLTEAVALLCDASAGRSCQEVYSWLTKQTDPSILLSALAAERTEAVAVNLLTVDPLRDLADRLEPAAGLALRRRALELGRDRTTTWNFLLTGPLIEEFDASLLEGFSSRYAAGEITFDAERLAEAAGGLGSQAAELRAQMLSADAPFAERVLAGILLLRADGLLDTDVEPLAELLVQNAAASGDAQVGDRISSLLWRGEMNDSVRRAKDRVSLRALAMQLEAGVKPTFALSSDPGNDPGTRALLESALDVLKNARESHYRLFYFDFVGGWATDAAYLLGDGRVPREVVERVIASSRAEHAVDYARKDERMGVDTVVAGLTQRMRKVHTDHRIPVLAELVSMPEVASGPYLAHVIEAVRRTGDEKLMASAVEMLDNVARLNDIEQRIAGQEHGGSSAELLRRSLIAQLGGEPDATWWSTFEALARLGDARDFDRFHRCTQQTWDDETNEPRARRVYAIYLEAAVARAR